MCAKGAIRRLESQSYKLRANIKLMVGSSARGRLPNITAWGSLPLFGQPQKGLESRRMPREGVDSDRSSTGWQRARPRAEGARAGRPRRGPKVASILKACSPQA